MVRGELRLEEFFNAAEFTKHGLLSLGGEHHERHQTEHGKASEAVFPSLHDVSLTTRVGLNNAALRWFRSHLVGGVFRTLLIAELLLEAITGPIALRQHTATRIANRVAGQRCTAAIRASTHALLLGWRRITIVQDDPHFFSNTSGNICGVKTQY